jgi:hypothetical protein
VNRQDWASLVRDTAAERRYMPGAVPRTTQVLLLRPEQLEGAFNPLELHLALSELEAMARHDTHTTHTTHNIMIATRDTRRVF